MATLAAGCSGGDDDDDDDRAESSSKEFVKAAVELEVSRAELVSPHKPLGPLDATTRDAVVGVVERLLQITSAGPLAAGRAGSGFAELFTPDAGTRAANQDREVFFDEGLRQFGELHPDEARVGLTGLAGSMDPATGLVVAKYVWDVESTENPGDRVRRTGELSLIPVDGKWRIGAYTIVVTRTLDDVTTTTTAESGS